MKIRGVIFDMDGTLVDSMWMWLEIDQEFLREFGCVVPEGLADAVEGMSYTETATYFQKTFSLPLSVAEIEKRWDQMAYDKYSTKVPWKPGAREWLEYLREKKIPVGIATSNSRCLVDAVLGALGASAWFSSIVTSGEVTRGKPAPDMYLRAASEMGVEPGECLVFEDVPAGLMAGINAGMHVIAVDDDFSAYLVKKKRELAEGYIYDYHQILEWIRDDELTLPLPEAEGPANRAEPCPESLGGDADCFS